ncbi:MAG: hypothetical protein E7620_04615 [Ruminococcaceae bacterium]|nr:hypothetical protein [Oscillospiraceae bacterium]
MKGVEYRAEELVYQSARLSILEMRMIGAARMERLLESGSLAECLRLLEEFGVAVRYREDGAFLREQTLSDRLSRVYEELLGDESKPFLRLWLYPYDCNNLKSVIKCLSRGVDFEGMLFNCGTIPRNDLIGAVRGHDFSLLPEAFAEAAREAAVTLATTGDPQTVDFILDRACYAAMLKEAEESGVAYAALLVRRKIDLTNLTVCVRLMRMVKPHALLRVLEQAYLPGGSLSYEELAALCEGDEEGFWKRLSRGEYGFLANALRGASASLSEIERAADNSMINYLKERRRGALGSEVLLGYLLGSEYEVRNLRILLSGLEIGLSEQALRERIRSSYV